MMIWFILHHHHHHLLRLLLALFLLVGILALPAELSLCNQRPLSFGLNERGQLGDTSNIDRNTPVMVDASRALGGLNISSVAVGFLHTLILADNGRVFSVGSNEFGQLGDGRRTHESTPIAVVTTDVLSGQIIVQIVCGSNHSLLVSATGQIFSFGSNSNGQLGDGTTSDRDTPVAVFVDGILNGKNIITVAGGWIHSLVLSDSGLVYSFGGNSDGQLGDGTTTDRLAPVAVDTTGILNSEHITAISAGVSHSLLLSASGHAFSFGKNQRGQLGDGTNIDRLFPVLVQSADVLGNVPIVAISAGAEHSLILSAPGNVYSFGLNNHGQLGDLTKTNRNTPTAVNSRGLPSNFFATQISAGRDHSLVVSESGIFAFGRNEYGQLGIGNNEDVSMLVAISFPDHLGELKIASIAKGNGHHSVLLLSSLESISAGKVWDGTEPGKQLAFQSNTNFVSSNWQAFIVTDSRGSWNATSYNITVIEKRTSRVMLYPTSVMFSQSQPIFTFQSDSHVPLLHNMTYITMVNAYFCDSVVGSSVGFLVDTTPPIIRGVNLFHELWSFDTDLTIEWDDIFDPESGIESLKIVYADTAKKPIQIDGCSPTIVEPSGTVNITWAECGALLPPGIEIKVGINATNQAGLSKTMFSTKGIWIFDLRITKLISWDETTQTPLKGCRRAVIEWHSLGLNDTKVELSVVEASSDVVVLILNKNEPVLAQSNQFEWEPVPESLPQGQYYVTLQALNITGPAPITMSNVFSVEPADSCIEVLSPNETSLWLAGDQESIEWLSWGSLPVSQVKFELMLEGHVSQVISTSEENENMTWTPPISLAPDMRYYVRASVQSPQGVVFSTQHFSLDNKWLHSSTGDDPWLPSEQTLIIIGAGILGTGALVAVLCLIIVGCTCCLILIRRCYHKRARRGSFSFSQPLLEDDVPAKRPSSRPSSRPTKSDIQIDHSELGDWKKLGAGAFGIVCRATYRGQYVAVKMLELSDEGIEEFGKEALVMVQLRHPRLLQFIGVTILPEVGRVGIVMEFMERGSLEGLLWDKKDSSIKLSWSSKMRILCDVAEGMAYIHSEGFIHRDLKSPNVLIGDDLRAKVADFGLARTQAKAMAKMTKVGSPLWLAPEIVTKDGRYDNKCDVFSFGIIMNEVLTEKQPYFHIDNLETILQRVLLDPTFRPHIPSVNEVKGNHPTSEERRAIDNVFMSFQWLMCACWDNEPTKRPTFAEISAQLSNLSQSY